jgi:type IV secretory pathway VirB2 component (pilin)
MKLVPNLSKTWRVIYAIVGLALILAPIAFTMSGWERVALPILGVMSIFTGATGW